MSRLTLERCCGILTQIALDKLKVHNIENVIEFLGRDVEEIAETTGLCYKDVVTLRSILLAQNASLCVTGKELYEKIVESTIIISTGIDCVDGLLDGGMYTGEVTEVCGGVAAGKTQMCMKICGKTLTAVNQTVVYIDTGASFSVKRLLQMLPDKIKTESVLSRLKLCKAFDVYEVFDVLSTVREKLREKADPFYSRLKLVILDNVASVVYPLIGGGTFADHQGLLCLLGRELKTLAVDNSIAILVTNNTVTTDNQVIVPSLGRVWSHIPNIRLSVKEEKDDPDKRSVKLLKSCRGETGKSAYFSLEADGTIK